MEFKISGGASGIISQSLKGSNHRLFFKNSLIKVPKNFLFRYEVLFQDNPL